MRPAGGGPPRLVRDRTPHAAAARPAHRLARQPAAGRPPRGRGDGDRTWGAAIVPPIGLRLRGDPLKVQITNPIQIGNSGGPLADQAGNVVGVVAGKLNPIKLLDLTGALPQNVNFAIKLEAVTQFLAAARAPFQRSSARERVGGVELVRDARKYTVLIACQA